MNSDDIKAITYKLAAVTDSFEARGDKSVQAITQSASHIHSLTKQAVEISDQVIASALKQFKAEAAQAMTTGLRELIDQSDQRLRSTTEALQQMAINLENQMQRMHKLQATAAWRTFIACAIASVAVMAAAGYAIYTASNQIERSEWVGSINAAVAKGKLTMCQDGGICVVVDKKIARLDK